MQMGSNGTVENGVSYAACICNGAEMEGQDKCGFHTEDARSYTITCNSGYTLQVGPQIFPLPQYPLAHVNNALADHDQILSCHHHCASVATPGGRLIMLLILGRAEGMSKCMLWAAELWLSKVAEIVRTLQAVAGALHVGWSSVASGHNHNMPGVCCIFASVILQPLKPL